MEEVASRALALPARTVEVLSPGGRARCEALGRLGILKWKAGHWIPAQQLAHLPEPQMPLFVKKNCDAGPRKPPTEALACTGGQ